MINIRFCTQHPMCRRKAREKAAFLFGNSREMGEKTKHERLHTSLAHNRMKSCIMYSILCVRMTATKNMTRTLNVCPLFLLYFVLFSVFYLTFGLVSGWAGLIFIFVCTLHSCREQYSSCRLESEPGYHVVERFRWWFAYIIVFMHVWAQECVRCVRCYFFLASLQFQPMSHIYSFIRIVCPIKLLLLLWTAKLSTIWFSSVVLTSHQIIRRI